MPYLLSSLAVRCLQTVEPMAARWGLTTETSEALGKGGAERLGAVIEATTSVGIRLSPMTAAS